MKTKAIRPSKNKGRNKTLKARKAPVESATSLPEGTIKSSYVIKKASNGVPRWVPTVSAELNGFRMLTVDQLVPGKSITLYVREYNEMWPKKNAWSKSTNETYFTVKFVPTGDATSGKTKLVGWLKSRKPEIKNGTMFSLDGPLTMNGDDHFADGVQVDSINKKSMSLNFMNQEVFVKV